jgi:ribosomal protein S18 acetylase RimI-like enzyme
MTDSPGLADIERAMVRAWPAKETAPIGGWLWRYSSGGSGRANSVACLDGPGLDVDAAIDEAEAQYRAVGAPARFQVTDVAMPGDLGRRLAVRGYRPYDACTTLALSLREPLAMSDDVVVEHGMSPAWFDVYASTVTPDRARNNPPILARIPQPCGFVTLRREGRAAATVLVVVDQSIAIIECVATAADARRQGAARTAVLGALAYGQSLGATVGALSAVATNLPAQALYRSLGFRQVGGYHLRIKE